MSNRLAALLADGIGETDCELIDDGFLAQPINALSSLAYVVVGVWLTSRALRRDGPERATQAAYGLALAGVGVGSFVFHGPMPPGARLIHDLTIASVFAVILARGAGHLRQWSEVAALAAAGGVTALIGVVMAVSPGGGLLLSGLVGTSAVAMEIFFYRSGRRPPLPGRAGRLLLVMVGLLVLAGSIQLLGRTGAPLCDPDGLFQAHGVWHVLTAIAFGIYGSLAFPAGWQVPPSPPTRRAAPIRW